MVRDDRAALGHPGPGQHSTIHGHRMPREAECRNGAGAKAGDAGTAMHPFGASSFYGLYLAV